MDLIIPSKESLLREELPTLNYFNIFDPDKKFGELSALQKYYVNYPIEIKSGEQLNQLMLDLDNHFYSEFRKGYKLKYVFAISLLSLFVMPFLLYLAAAPFKLQENLSKPVIDNVIVPLYILGIFSPIFAFLAYMLNFSLNGFKKARQGESKQMAMVQNLYHSIKDLNQEELRLVAQQAQSLPMVLALFRTNSYFNQLMKEALRTVKETKKSEKIKRPIHWVTIFISSLVSSYFGYILSLINRKRLDSNLPGFLLITVLFWPTVVTVRSSLLFFLTNFAFAIIAAFVNYRGYKNFKNDSKNSEVMKKFPFLDVSLVLISVFLFVIVHSLILN